MSIVSRQMDNGVENLPRTLRSCDRDLLAVLFACSEMYMSQALALLVAMECRL